MLTELRLANFAIIEQLNLQWHDGFTVLTGETGAGKSILIDALALLVGGRASADQIRTGADEAHLEASFALPPLHPLVPRLRDQGLLGTSETDLIIRRVLSRSGRHRTYLNGTLSPLHLLDELGGTLVDIHGQHDQQSLLSVGQQLDALDGFGRLKELRTHYREAYAQWKALQRESEELTRQSSERTQQEGFLRFQHREIEEAGFQLGDDERLQAERQRLAHAQQLGTLAQQAYDRLSGEEPGVLRELSAVGKALEELTTIDTEVREWKDLTDETRVTLKEVSRFLRDYRLRCDSDPDRLAHVEQRLDLLQKLKKKYGGSLPAVLAYSEQVEQALAQLNSADSQIGALHQAMGAAGQRVQTLGTQLTRQRQQAAKRLQKRTAAELATLRMEQTAFEIEVRSESDETAAKETGCDTVEFLLSANPAEPLRPLARVASGGELSRIMLALKTVLADVDRVPVLVFDEVDAGVGGAVAAVIGKRLQELGTHHQVLCITHLPQVAAHADHHVLVKKNVKQGRTVTSAVELEPHEREGEIARMLGGLTVTQKVRATATEMIGSAKGKK